MLRIVDTRVDLEPLEGQPEARREVEKAKVGYEGLLETHGKDPIAVFAKANLLEMAKVAKDEDEQLRYLEELKPAAISQVVGLPGTAVRKALQRAREQLRQCIERKAAAEGLG